MSSTGAGTGEQLSLVRASTRRRRSAAPAPDLAAVDPVAVVAVDVGLAHLDRPFEYSVPETLAEAAVPGARVKVRFAGQDVDGFVARAPGRGRARGPAGAAAAGRQPRAGPHARAAGPLPGGRRALRRHARRRAAAGGPAAPRGRGEGPRRASRPGRRRCRRPARWARYPAGPSCAGSPPGRRRQRRGWRSRGSTPTGPPRRGCGRRPARASTAGEDADWCRRCRRRLAGRARGRRRHRARGGTRRPDRRARPPRRRPGRRRPHGGPRHRPPRAADRRPGPAGALHGLAEGAARPRPLRRRHPGGGVRARCTTWGWWPGGTTATTCSPSRARPTPTCARCSRCGPAPRAPPC